MKKSSKRIIAGLVAGLCALPGMQFTASADPVEVSLDVPVLNAYVWRGQVINDRAVVQPSMTITKGGFTFNYWQNFDLDEQGTGNSMEFSEHDITLAYTFTCPVTGAGITAGIVNYDFPNSTAADTREGYISLGFGDCPLAPTLSVYRDFREANGFYANIAFSHSIPLVEETASLDLGFSTGAADSDYNSYYFGVDKTKMNDGTVSASIPYKITDSLTIKPGVAYVWLWDSDIEDAADSLYYGKDQVVGSLTASLTF